MDADILIPFELVINIFSLLLIQTGFLTVLVSNILIIFMFLLNSVFISSFPLTNRLKAKRKARLKNTLSFTKEPAANT